jgi:hypothetical protein
MPAKIIPLYDAAAFDPETMKIISEAYDRACRALRDRGQPDIVNELIARRIIALVKAGERDAQRMRDRVLSDVGIDRTD